MRKISTSQLQLLLKGSGGKLALINTLPEEHFADTKIPHSDNVPLDSPDFEQRVTEIAGDKTRPVVVYCTGTDCPSSGKAAERLRASGFTDIWDYEGGADAWNSEAGDSATVD